MTTTPRIETFETPGPIELTVASQIGRIDVAATDDDVSTVEISSARDDERARTMIERTRVELHGGRLVITTPNRFTWRNADLVIAVRVPIGSSLTAKLAATRLTTSGELSKVSVHAASGDIHLGDVTGDVSVHSASGRVHLASAGGRATVRSASGDIEVGRAGRELIAHSASGDLAVGSAAGSVRARTASGDIRIGALERGRVELSSASGDLDVGIARGAGVWLDVTSVSGVTASELEIGAVEPAAGCALQLVARTLSGDITLTRAPEAQTVA